MAEAVQPMRALAIGALVLLLSCPGSIARTLTVGNYLEQSGEDLKGLKKVWIDGAYNGLQSANGFLKAAGKPPVLCLPPKIILTNEQILSILDLYLAAHATPKDMPVDTALLKALREAYPCPSQ